MPRVIGIDPGSRRTGYGVVDSDGGGHRHVANGHIAVSGESFPDRLKGIFEGLVEVLDTYRPEVMAVERVFLQHNPDSALKLGQARGAAICAGVLRNLSVTEYTPREIKQAVVGTGAASKEQVQHMVTALLSLETPPQEDAADALAVALCHLNTSQGLAALVAGRGGRRRRGWR